MSNERSKLINNSTSQQIVDSVQGKYEEYIRPSLAEFFGVTLFVCVGCLAVLQSGGQSTSVPFSGIGIAVGHGLTIALLIAAMGDVR